MKAYKAFEKNLTCRGYQYKLDGTNVTGEANCVHNGFHCAENPLDCLTYYPVWSDSRYFIVKAHGDIDEDGTDSKISCTELEFEEELTAKRFAEEAILYMKKRPYRTLWTGNTCGICVQRDRAEAEIIAIARGKKPMAAGKKGAVLGLVVEENMKKVADTVVIVVDGTEILPDVFYTVKDGKVVQE